MNKKMNWFYKNREQRSKWLAERFFKEISNTNLILDLGCYNQDLRKYIPDNLEYTGIDIAGKPDIYLNFDKIDKLPFNDNQFDISVCADVLEHLENIHLIFDELCRVSAKYIIITLPNTYASIPEILKGKKYTQDAVKRKEFGKILKFYGLPFEKPQDRHRWFFSFDEAVEFVKYRAKKFNFDIDTIESEYKYQKHPFFKKIFFFILRKINKNLVDKNVIILLKKKENVS